MKLANINIGLCVTGSFCTLNDNLEMVKRLVSEGGNVTPIFSEAVQTSANKFSNRDSRYEILSGITGNEVIDTIVKAEPIGPKKLFDIILVAPCTGNTLSKIANSITDTTVTMAIKAHLRNQSPILIGISSNDALGLNAKNLGVLLNSKNIYFVPFYQDAPILKENSLMFDGDKVEDAIIMAINGKQLQPIILGTK